MALRDEVCQLLKVACPMTVKPVLLIVLAFMANACKSSSSDVKDLGDDEPALIDKIKPILVKNGCPACHPSYGEADFLKKWALLTKDTYDYVYSFGFGATPPDPLRVSGIYKAYPEELKFRFFEDFRPEAEFDAWAARIRPDPQMKIEKDDFFPLEQLMLALADFARPKGVYTCQTRTSDEYKAHVRRMKTEGWGAKITAMTKSYGCPNGSKDPTSCLSDATKWPSHPDLVNPDVGVSGTRVVELGEVGTTQYWTRSSPTGRYVGNGGPARIDDLEKKIRYQIKGSKYDPGFFPDNSGFTFHGGAAIFCPMQIVRPNGTDVGFAMGNAPWQQYEIDPHANDFCLFGDKPASDAVMSYQNAGMGPSGRAFVVSGDYEGDNGFSIDLARFDLSTLIVYELKKTVGGYERVGTSTHFDMRQHGDFVISPSTEYLADKIGAKRRPNYLSQQLGYDIRSLAKMMTAGKNYKPNEDSSVSEYCVEGMGSKVQFSYDERFFTFHMYEKEGTVDGTADIFVIDTMQPGKVFRVTNFIGGGRLAGRGKALSPHFRADGWLYFRVEPGMTTREDCPSDEICYLPQTGPKTAIMMASDIALRIAKEIALE
jgi:hypothetical protein